MNHEQSLTNMHNPLRMATLREEEPEAEEEAPPSAVNALVPAAKPAG